MSKRSVPAVERRQHMSGGDFARLALRGAVGSSMLAHGIRHARTLDGTARWFAGIGFTQPRLQATTSAVVEIGSGCALVAGAATPAAAATVIGTMGVAARSVHVQNGYFVINEGYEYVLSLAVMAASLAALGPGRFSVDRFLPALRDRHGAGVGLGSMALGVAGAAVQLGVFWRRPVPAS